MNGFGIFGRLLLCFSYTVSFAQVPAAVFLFADKTTVCTNQQVNFTVYPDGAYTYKLYVNGNNLTDYTDNTFQRSPTGSGTVNYQIQITDGTNIVTSNTVSVQVNGRPTNMGTVTQPSGAYNTTSPPVDLEQFVTGLSDDITFHAPNDPGVHENTFYPSTGAGTYEISYYLTNAAGCTSDGTTQIIANVTGNQAAPYFIKAMPCCPFPLCQSGTTQQVQINIGGTDQYLTRISVKDATTNGEYINQYFNPEDNPDDDDHVVWYSNRIIDVVPENHSNFVIDVEVVFLRYYNSSGWLPITLRGTIPVYPRRIVDLIGLPKKGLNNEVLLCASNQDTLTLRAAPSSGTFAFYKTIGGVDSLMPSGFSPYGVSKSDSSSTRRFLPAQLFADSGYADYSNTFRVEYTYPKANQGVCPATNTSIIKFNPPKNIQYNIVQDPWDNNPMYCHGDTMKFEVIDNENIPNTEYFWNYDDGYSETVWYTQNQHRYQEPGKYRLRFKSVVPTLLSPDSTCNADFLTEIIVGAKPASSFSIRGLIENQVSTLVDATALALPNPDNDDDIIDSWTWYFDAPSTFPSYSTTIEADKNTNHIFPTRRELPYAVSLVTTTPPHYPGYAFGCKDSLTRYIPIFPIDTPRSSEFYIDSFEVAGTGWYKSGDYRIGGNSSWQSKEPTGTTIQDAGNTAWVTDNGKTDSLYNFSEFSWIESPAFYLDSLEFPLLWMRTWNKSENQLDGACLQWTFADVPFGEEVWTTVGGAGAGSGWYTSPIIVSMIDKVTKVGTTTPGWTGINSTWVESRVAIDEVRNAAPSRPVRFRVLFSSNSDNAPGEFDGFAFDNFFIGERNRRILVEEFCDYQNFEPQFANINSDPQLIRLQYHPRTVVLNDIINNQNKQEPSARSLQYGYSSLPRAAVDGVGVNHLKEFFDPTNTSGLDFYNYRKLETAEFDISISSNPVTGNALPISTTITRKSSLANSGPFVVMIGVVEDSVYTTQGNFRRVLRKFLPNAGGEVIETWPLNSSMTFSRQWTPFTTITNQSEIRLVVFVQNLNTKEVYQAEEIILPYSEVEDLTPVALPLRLNSEEVLLHPNPSNGNFSVGLNGYTGVFEYEILNTLGHSLKSGSSIAGEEIYASDLPAGTYMLKLSTDRDMVMYPISIQK